ncbi:MAG: glutamate racemase [Clostridiales bacterium GWF2_36_10]|nr:MAG: glutamate racemase [Clostridiales bacterium GWF2_36_10]HAN20301.1 glutamate racemase [Clostridiales bacterium]
MINQPIGIFDSGLGGLTAISEIQRLMPDEDYIYFGDTARIPYGTRSREVIKKYSMQDCRFLILKGVKAILIACGTVSSNALDTLTESFTLPIIGVVEGAAKRAVEVAQAGNGIIAVLGTDATINSGAFKKAIEKINPTLKVISKSCPMFVPLVENGHIAKDDIAANAIAREYLAEIEPLKPSAVILGCTHYPLLTDILEDILPDSTLISSGKEAAVTLKEKLLSIGLLTGTGCGKTLFYTSDDITLFAKHAKRFLGKDISVNIHKTDIENY